MSHSRDSKKCISPGSSLLLISENISSNGSRSKKSKSNSKILSLTKDETDILDTLCENLKEICHKEDMHFDENRFKKLVKNVYVHLSDGRLKGGAKSKKLVVYKETEKPSIKTSTKRVILLDFAAVLAFLLGVVLLYISYIKFSRTVCELTSTDNMKDLTDVIQTAAKDALDQVPNEDIGFVYYFWSIFTGFGSKLFVEYQSRIINTFSEAVKKIVTDSASTITHNCITPQSEGILGALESMFTITDTNAVNACIMQTTKSITNKVMNDIAVNIELFTSKTTLTMTNTTNLANYGIRFIQGSIGYITIRYGNRIAYTRSSRVEELEGGRKRRTRKSL